MYIKRHAESTILEMSKMFGAVLVTGPRQAGKTTTLKELLQDTRYVSLDDTFARSQAINAPHTFIRDNMPPVFIDEIQKAPGLFPEIKLILDQKKKKGQFFLSGSQQFHMMKNVSESLSGRIGILALPGVSFRERMEIADRTPFLTNDKYLAERTSTLSGLDQDTLWEIIWRGSMPELVANPDFNWKMYYSAYVSTYVERDVRELTQVGDTIKFTRFMEVIAAHNSQMLNLQSIAGEVGISHPTAERWLSILTASHLVYLLRPYSNNLTKRAVKTPKLYFMDTGLAAFLSNWNTPEVLRSGAMSGAYFEDFVISEIIKSYYNCGISEPPIYYYRDRDKKEIDLIIDQDGCLYSYEIKKHADPSLKDIKNFSVLSHIAGNRKCKGGVICTYEKPASLNDDFMIIPVSYL